LNEFRQRSSEMISIVGLFSAEGGMLGVKEVGHELKPIV
jgi:hypothetical protein